VSEGGALSRVGGRGRLNSGGSGMRFRKGFARKLLVTLFAVSVVAGSVAWTVPDAGAATSSSMALVRHETTRIPPKLRLAFARSIARQRAASSRLAQNQFLQLTPTYGANGVRFSSHEGSFAVGDPELGRADQLSRFPMSVVHSPEGAQYRAPTVVEGFGEVPSGIEQSFRIARAPVGNGPLLIELPISGDRVRSEGTVIDVLEDGSVGATYSDLRVTDSNGHEVPSSLLVANEGKSIEIESDWVPWRLHTLEEDGAWRRAEEPRRGTRLS
jgi:hypothetical protein